MNNTKTYKILAVILMSCAVLSGCGPREPGGHNAAGYPYAPVVAADTRMKIADYVADERLMSTPMLRSEGFQLLNQSDSSIGSYNLQRLIRSIEYYKLGEYTSLTPTAAAWEWGYSVTHLNGITDGAGREITTNYSGKNTPETREQAVEKLREFLLRQYIGGAPHPWMSVNGHYPWHHYAGEFGFDVLGSEIGESINNYQWHAALTRGAARQYQTPWVMDFSAWHGPGITDYSEQKIWGDNSGANHGHSMSLFRRALLMSIMSGADMVQAEAGAAISFYDRTDGDYYALSPYGEVMRELAAFVAANPDRGITLAPVGVVLDYYHGAYSGFDGRRAFYVFNYTGGDRMTYALIDKIWPGGWEVMDKKETGTMVNGAYGDSFDVLLQNAPQEILNCYPSLVLSGDIALSSDEIKRYEAYVKQGGTLILNRAYADYFPGYFAHTEPGLPGAAWGRGHVITYGDQPFDLAGIEDILHGVISDAVPFILSGDIEYIVNVKNGSMIVTLINNDGVTKDYRADPVVDETKRKTVSVAYTGGLPVLSCADIYNNLPLTVTDGAVTLTIEAGDCAVLEFVFG